MSYASVIHNEMDLEFEIHPISYSEDHEYGHVTHDVNYEIGRTILDGELLSKEEANELHDKFSGTSHFDEQVREICREWVVDKFTSDS